MGGSIFGACEFGIFLRGNAIGRNLVRVLGEIVAKSRNRWW